MSAGFGPIGDARVEVRVNFGPLKRDLAQAQQHFGRAVGAMERQSTGLRRAIRPAFPPPAGDS